jgi:hypothetical protein
MTQEKVVVYTKHLVAGLPGKEKRKSKIMHII